MNKSTFFPGASNPFFCILVHGTWGREATFAEVDSKLAQRIRELCPSSRITFIRFEWNGRNSHVSRTRTANRLATQVKELLISNPDASFGFIAHSHGGNIVRLALQNRFVELRTRFAIYLGTPFIELEVDHAKSALIATGLLVGGVSFGFVGIFIVMIGFFYDFIGVYRFIWYFFSIYLLFLLALLVSQLAGYGDSVEKIAKKLDALEEEVSGHVNAPTEINCPELVVRAKHDEALVWLKFIFWISRIPLNVTRVISLLEASDITRKACKYIMLALMFLCTSWLLRNVSSFPEFFLAIVIPPALATVIISFTFGMFVIAQMISSFVLIGGFMGVGKGFFSFDFWVRASVSGAPSDSKLRKQLVFRYPASKIPRHSWLYKDENVVHEVSRWIAKEVSEAVKEDTHGSRASGRD